MSLWEGTLATTCIRFDNSHPKGAQGGRSSRIKVGYNTNCQGLHLAKESIVNDDELRQLLEELHQRIESTNSVDEKGRELLSHLSVDIRNLLERTGHETQLRGTSHEVGRLQESIEHFEVSHPNLTAALSQLLNILNNAGI